MDIQIFGAAREVTGSMHVLTVGSEKILLDCGLFQGHRKDAFERNSKLPFEAESITAMVLSHAHIDHSGNIPLLLKSGYKGNIFTTHATQDLANVMLRDSAYIQQKDAEYINKKNKKKGLDPIEPIYTMADAEAALPHFVSIGYRRPFYITKNVRLTFYDAGHILGSAIVVLDVEENGKNYRFLFTGDLGRKNLPVIKDPEYIAETDFYMTESTYGNREHEDIVNMKQGLKDLISRTVTRGGKIIVPAFSVGRTQELVYFLHELFNEGSLPEIPIYVDSPLSVNVTEVFRLHTECYDKETREQFLQNHQDPFGFYRLRYIRHVEDSKKLNTSNEPAIIISASGMCETGRILHHLANNIEDPKNSILIVGFMAANTLGRRLVERIPVIKIYGEEYKLNAEVKITNGFSAHADKHELLEYFNQLNKSRLKKTIIVHGEEEAALNLGTEMKKTGFTNITIPERGDRIELA